MYRAWLLACLALLPIGALSFAAYALAILSLPALLFLVVLSLRQPRAPQSNADCFRNLVLAHRGGQMQAGSEGPVFPENSLAAFRWASSDRCGGADGFELDVWLSKDGVPMVNHVRRTPTRTTERSVQRRRAMLHFAHSVALLFISRSCRMRPCFVTSKARVQSIA